MRGGRWSLVWALLALAAAGPAVARFDASQTSDYAFKERSLCYSLTARMKADPKWAGWAAQAAANWNAVSAQTGWSFHECADSEKGDISIGFGVSSDPTDSGGGSFGGDAGEAQHAGQSLKQPHYDLKVVGDVAGKTINGVKIGSGGDQGWDTDGATSLDPVMVLMHEMTHAMRLSHEGEPFNKGAVGSPFDFERPVGPGVHTATISTDDIKQTHASAVEGKPPVNLGYKLPACFADEVARAKAASDLKAIIWQLEQTIEVSAGDLVHSQGPSETAGLYAQGRQAQSNLEAAQAMAGALAAVPICPPPVETAKEHAMAPRPGGGGNLAAQVLYEINFARTEPAAYARTLGPGAEEAAAFLRAQAPLAPLRLSAGLASSAARHAADQARLAQVGHTGSDGSTMGQRIHAQGIVAGVMAEEMALGQTTGREVARQLIVDAESPIHAHRADLFDPSLQLAGVGCGPQRVYGEICVIDLAGAVMK